MGRAAQGSGDAQHRWKGCGGVRERRHARLLAAGQANGQRLRGELQRTPARRVPEQPLGSCRWRTPEPRSRRGGGTATGAVLTRRFAG
ncbi:Transposase [Granulibacter bethesdensis]|uniref:Transposase n=1 Tax=Granulibacter bethesdensis TaxID=364410 RepID=A0AAC9P8N6_9PROT|nr:Transposase [Granulibacter bethesdensis]APH61781.1 Transposase [Granulibacter bethesdensis]